METNQRKASVQMVQMQYWPQAAINCENKRDLGEQRLAISFTVLLVICRDVPISFTWNFYMVCFITALQYTQLQLAPPCGKGARYRLSVGCLLPQARYDGLVNKHLDSEKCVLLSAVCCMLVYFRSLQRAEIYEL